MRNTRRFAALGATLVVAGTIVAGPAAAQTEADLKSAKAFDGSAYADALTLTLFGQPITSSAVTAAVSPSTAKATVTETFLGPLNEAAVFVAEQPGGDAEAKPEACLGS